MRLPRHFLALALLLLAAPVWAQSTATPVVPGAIVTTGCPPGFLSCFVQGNFANLTPLGYQQLTSLGSAVGLTVPSGSREALIVCTGQTVNWRDDGTAPTTTVGMPLTVNTLLTYAGTLSAIQIIQTSATATCNVSYYR